MMTEIYGKARKVYIWLGEPSKGKQSERALGWLISEPMHISATLSPVFRYLYQL